jgi:hypothetical protein
VPAEDVFHAVKAVVAVQRDYGRRDDRKQVGTTPAHRRRQRRDLCCRRLAPWVWCGLRQGALAAAALTGCCPGLLLTCCLTRLPPALLYRQARLKYLIHEWGVDKFRSVVEQYYGKKLQPFRPLPPWEFKDYLGWMEQGDGKLAYGIYVQVRACLCGCVCSRARGKEEEGRGRGGSWDAAAMRGASTRGRGDSVSTAG